MPHNVKSKQDPSLTSQHINNYIKVPLHRTYFGVKTDPLGRRSGLYPRCGPGNYCSEHSNAEKSALISLYYSYNNNLYVCFLFAITACAKLLKDVSQIDFKAIRC